MNGLILYFEGGIHFSSRSLLTIQDGSGEERVTVVARGQQLVRQVNIWFQSPKAINKRAKKTAYVTEIFATASRNNFSPKNSTKKKASSSKYPDKQRSETGNYFC